ncbi:MAG TPA: hypothetical protein VHK86_08905 [Nitrososphaera sp.]|jgi:hypothetical protein|nr:hypothetical protein [Nitrososphaera sp.]
MPETICRQCGCDLQSGAATCPLCSQNLTMECSNCDYVSEVKVHVDCLNAEQLIDMPYEVKL